MMNDEIITQKDVEKVSGDIELALASLYKYERAGTREKLHPLVLGILKSTDKSLISEKLVKLREDVKSYETLSMGVAFAPGRETVLKIHSWLLTNLGMRVILSFDLNPKLLGGCVVAFRGKYSDHSLNKKIEAYFGNKVTL